MEKHTATLAIAILGTLLACNRQPEWHATPTDDDTLTQAQPSAVDKTASEVRPSIDVDDTTPLDLHFGWTPGRLKVTEKSNKKGRDSEMSYTLEVTEVSGGLTVEYRDFHFTSFEGFDLQDPAIRAQFADVERSVGMMQLGFRVSPDGAFVGLLDLDALTRGYEALQGPEDAAKLRKLLENPQWLGLMEEGTAKPWRAWVELWIGLEAAPGEVVESEVEVDFGGTPLLQHVRHEHHGRDPSLPGHVRLRYEQRTNDPRFMAAIGDLAKGLGDEVAPDKLAKIQTVADEAQDAVQFEYKRVIEVSLDPRTMIPAWAKDVMNASFRGREPGLIEDVQRVESREWTFEVVRG